MSNPTLFILAGLPVTLYLLLLSGGVLLILFLARISMNKESIPKSAARIFLLTALPLGLVFARLGYGLIYLPDTMDNPMGLLDINQEGFVLYGAALGVLLAAFLAARSTKGSLTRLLDILAPSAALMIAMARLLEGMVGMGYSFYTDNEALWFFPICVYDSYWEAWALALFVLEGLYALLIFALLLKNTTKPGCGDRLSLLAFLYAVMQIWFESLRRDAYARVGFIRVMQLASAVLAALVLLYWLLGAKRGFRYTLPRAAAYLAALGVVLLMEFAVEYKVGFLVVLHQRWQLNQTEHYALCYGIMLMAVLAALMLGLRARSAYNTEKQLSKAPAG